MSSPVRLALDPLAHQTAIQALEAQRAAYARFARTMDAHRSAVAGGSGDAAVAAADAAARGHDELAAGARRLAPLVAVAGAPAPGDDTEHAEVARRLDAVMQEARAAEAAIHHLTAQLEAWRDAYGRQLAELGLPPGAAGPAPDGVAPTAGAGRAAAGYAPRSAAGDRPQAPALLDRKG
jgi:hypothetical protein